MVYNTELLLRDPTEQASPSPHLQMETYPVSDTFFSQHLEFLAMDKVQKLSNSECYAPSFETSDSNTLSLFLVFLTNVF
jgi:hypothetical protein